MNFFPTKLIIAVWLSISPSMVVAKPPSLGDLTDQAVEVALQAYFSDAKNSERILYRSVFTPGTGHVVNKHRLRVASRSEIEAGKEVSFARVTKVTIRESTDDPSKLTILVTIATWYEVGGRRGAPMHAFSNYELQLNEDGCLLVVGKSTVLE